jgi:hypothetical protein
MEKTIEQKAKAYDEAIEKAKEEYDKADGITKESLKKVFPQEKVILMKKKKYII